MSAEGHQQVMSPKQATSAPHLSSCMLRRRRSMEHGTSLALPQPEEDAARASGEEAGKVKEREGVEKDEKGLMTPTRSTTGPPGSATGPTTEMEVFRSGGSKQSMKELTEQPKGRPVTLAPLVPPQPQTMPPLFTREQIKSCRPSRMSGVWKGATSIVLHSFKKKKKGLKEEEEERKGLKEAMMRRKAKSSGDVRMRIQKILEAATEVAFKKKRKKRSCGAGRSRRI